MTLIFWNAYGNGTVGASDDVAWDHALRVPIVPLCLSREEGVIFFPLEPKKQRSKKMNLKQIIITPDLRLVTMSSNISR